MIHQVYTIYDSKVDAHLPPFYAQTDAAAVRMFTECATDPEHAFGKFGADYTLFHLGTYCDLTATFKLTNAHNNLGTALQAAQTRQWLGNVAPVPLDQAANAMADKLRKQFATENNLPKEESTK